MCNGMGIKPDQACRQAAFRLSELPSAYHCGILGNCIKITDLRKLLNKFSVQDMLSRSDYDVHHFFVHQVSESNPISKHINKLLNRQFALTIKQLRKATSAQALLAYWQEQCGWHDQGVSEGACHC